MQAGGTDAYDFRPDLRAVYQYYCHNHPKPDEEQYPLWSGLAADSKMTRDELAARMKDCTGVGLTTDQRSAAQQQNLDNIINVIRIPERTLVSHLAWVIGTASCRERGGEVVMSAMGECSIKKQ